MKPSLLLAFFLLFFGATAAAQTISGVLTNAETHAALPYVNIGVVGKSLGTVSTEQGAYRLAFQEALANDTVRISSIGYQTRLLTLRALRAQPNVALAPASVTLQEVQVQGTGLLKRPRTLGNTSNSLTSNLNLNTKALGTEIGTVISIRHHPTRVLTANFNVCYNKLGPVTFRVNLYRLDAKGRPTEIKLLAHDVITTADIKTGTFTVDLANEHLVVDEDFFLALEWIKGNGLEAGAGQPTRLAPLKVRVQRQQTTDGVPAPPPQPQELAFSLSVGYINNDLYVRSTSQASWERAAIGALLAGMQPRISFFVTALD